MVIKGLKALSSYFPNNVLEELSDDLKDKKFRLHLVNKKTTRDLTMLCSFRDIIRLDKNNNEVYNLRDNELILYSGSLECGEYIIKTILDGSDDFGRILDYEKIPPKLGNDNTILMKKGVVSDSYKNYFNHNFINVYAIV